MREGQRMWNKKKYIRVKRKKERKKHWKGRVEVCAKRMWNKKKYIRVKEKKERKKHWKERVEVCVKGRECGIKKKEERNIGRI